MTAIATLTAFRRPALAGAGLLQRLRRVYALWLPTLRMGLSADSGAMLAWSLPARQAQTLHPGVAGWLEVQGGRAWITGAAGAGDADLVLEPGQSVALRAGERVVVENWPRADGDCLRLAWRVKEPKA